jgi:type IV pilus assembly protein PilB
MGVAPFNVASSVLLITAQRLARRLCESCKKPADLPAGGAAQGRLRRQDLDVQLAALPRGGLRVPARMAYKGRVGLYQVMPITEDDPAHHPVPRARPLDIAEQARREGVRDLRQRACSRSARA